MLKKVDYPELKLGKAEFSHKPLLKAEFGKADAGKKLDYKTKEG